MKTKYYLIALATIILGLTGFGYAQEGYFNAEEGNGKWSAVEAPRSPANTERAYFNAETGNVLPLEKLSSPAMREVAGKTDKLEIESASKLGDVTLKRGQYLVRHVDTGKEHFVEFSQIIENDYVPEGQSVYVRKVVARLNCTRKPLGTTVARTELVTKTASATALLEIRGEKVAHLF